MANYHFVTFERDVDLRNLYRRIISQNKINRRYMSHDAIVDVIRESPAPRFYISAFAASRYVIEEIQGINKVRRKRDMIDDLMENYYRLVRENPNMKKEDLYDLLSRQPAKSFYMSKHRIKEIIFNYTGRNKKKAE